MGPRLEPDQVNLESADWVVVSDLLNRLASRQSWSKVLVQDATERLVKHLKEELERWKSKYKKVKASV